MSEEQIQELYQAVRSLLNDIEAMQHSEMTNLFGPFSISSQHGDGDVSIQWDNLDISAERVRAALEEMDQ